MSNDEQLIDAADPSGAAGDVDDSVDARVERILQHVDDSLNQVDALQATVGAASGDLMLLQYRLRQAIDETLQEAPDSLTAITEVMPALNTYIKLSQQVDRYVNLSMKIKTAKEAH